MRLQLAVLSALCVAASASRKSYDGYKVYDVTGNERKLVLLDIFNDRPGYDFWSKSKTGPISIMVAPFNQNYFQTFLKTYNISYQTLIENVEVVNEAERENQLRVGYRKQRISFTNYHRHTEINDYLDNLAAAHPDMVTVTVIGKSFEGRDLKLIKISSGGSNKPAILVDAGIHAREWIAPAMALYIIDQLVKAGPSGDLIKKVDWHILPVLNPDGYEYSHTTDRFWRKTRSPGSKSCVGVDANRNFDYHWNEIGSSSDPCSLGYAGPSAFSELETQALRDYILNKSGNFKLYLALHSYGNLLLYPWGFTTTLPSDWQTLDNLAQDVNVAQRNAGGKDYKIGISPDLLSPGSGLSKDWVKAVGDIALTYTVELPGGGLAGFDLPPELINITVTQFFEGVRVFGKYVSSLT